MSTDDKRLRPPLVILDRDGVINQDSDAYIKSPEEWIAIPGSLEAIARLNHAGILVAVASNQSGLGRGMFDLDTLNAIHAKFHQALGRVGGHVDGIFFCPHIPQDNCDCRKPRPCLLHAISQRFDLPLDGIPFIGDSPADVAAARAVMAQPMLVCTGKGEHSLSKNSDLRSLPVFGDLAEAVDDLLRTEVSA